MPVRKRTTIDGNEAAASVAFRVSETIAIYPITPSSPMAELCDEWAEPRAQTNLWGVTPSIAEMQSEAAPRAPCTARCRRARSPRRSRRPRACSS